MTLFPNPSSLPFRKAAFGALLALLGAPMSLRAGSPPPEPVGHVVAYELMTTHSLYQMVSGENSGRSADFAAVTSITLAAKSDDGESTYVVMSETKPLAMGSDDGPGVPAVRVVRVTPAGRISEVFAMGSDVVTPPFLNVAIQNNSPARKRDDAGAVGVDFPALNMSVYLELSEPKGKIRTLGAPIQRVRSGPYPVDIRAAQGSLEVADKSATFATSATVQVAVVASSPEKMSYLAAVESSGRQIPAPKSLTEAEAGELLAELLSSNQITPLLMELSSSPNAANLEAAQKAVNSHVSRFPKGMLTAQIQEAIAQMEESVRRAETRSSQTPGKPAPAIESKTITDESFRLADFKGKVVLVDFWATWCPPCIAELPTMVELHDKYKDDLVIVGISADRELSDLTTFVKERKISWRQVFEPDPSGSWHKAFGIAGYPTYILINRDGSIAARDLRGQELTDAINQLVSKP